MRGRFAGAPANEGARLDSAKKHLDFFSERIFLPCCACRGDLHGLSRDLIESGNCRGQGTLSVFRLIQVEIIVI